MVAKKERRVAERFPMQFLDSATFCVQGEDEQRECTTRDISQTGAYFLAESCPNVGEQVKVRLELPESNAVLEARGTVVRVEDASEETSGFAIHFEAAPSVAKA